jgi:chromate reductase, NAD(P)H dehydrogenase (quinone)
MRAVQRLNFGAMKILTIPGSLRPDSSSNKILKHITADFPASTLISNYDPGTLPHFNDSQDTPATVNDFRKQIKEADGILICQPEYAFGVAGTLKNALDWTVGSGEFFNKPVALITAATGGENAHAAMLLTLKAMNAFIADGTTLVIPFVKAKLNVDGTVKDPDVLKQLRNVAMNFYSSLESLPEKN